MDFIFDETREDMEYFWKRPVPSYTRPYADPRSYWGQLVILELKTIWRIKRTFDDFGLGIFLRQFISNNPYRDISLITWAFTIYGWWEYGIKMVWVTILNLFFVFVLRAVVQAPRPFEYDRNLRPLADRQISSYGCPSIESFMAVVTFGYLAYRVGNGNPLWQLITVSISLLIGLTRIYAGSRFIHQVCVSWLLGSITLYMYITKFQPFVPDWGEDVKNKKVRIALMVPWGMAFLAYISLALEDNTSSLFRIPNSEFMRVMTHIQDTGAAADVVEEQQQRNKNDRARRRGGRRNKYGDSIDEDDDEDDDDPLMRRYRDQNASKQERIKRQLAKRKDSFYFLQHSLRSKDIERVSINFQARQADDGSNPQHHHDTADK